MHLSGPRSLVALTFIYMPFRTLVLFGALSLLVPSAFGQSPEQWLQHVDYQMDVTLHADRHQMDGYQRLTYTNNSPDTLHTVYYHLYFNAFNPQSMMAERNRHLPDPDERVVPRIFNLGPDEVGYHRIRSLTQDGQPVDYQINDTVMRVELDAPILPGDSTTFEMRFHSQVPLQTRRSGWMNREGVEFSMSQWYPKMAEYDERGWHADPYVGREFYAPYGRFDVKITLPATYSIGATGVLQNPNEVGHGYDLEGTGVYRPGDAAYAADDSLTWHFVADHVHDFAWAADPDYIHEKIEGRDGLSYHLLYETDVEERWRPMKQWVPALIRFFSRSYGPYPYPQFTVIQAGDGGMEYPMVNFLTGERGPGSLLGVTAHEAAHEWFYATLGSNEADYAWMDEGFTSYATTEGVGHVANQQNPSHQSAYASVLLAQDVGLFEALSTPADWFQTNFGYGIASYPGGEMLVDMMGYVISDSLRDAWLKEYYRERKFQHPDPFDLEKFAEDVSGLHLDWYFWQFTHSTRELDYAITDLEQTPSGDGYRVTLSMARKAAAAMPQDVRFTLADGTEQWINVPLLVMQGHKPVPEDWIVTEPWPWTYPTYEVTVEVPARVEKAELDPQGRTPDRNRLNNSTEFPVRTRFLEPPAQSWFEYEIGWRPLAQYADLFGGGGGLQTRGQYLFGRYRVQAMLKLWPQVLISDGSDPDLPTADDEGSWLGGIDYAFQYTHPVRGLGPRTTASLSAAKHLGLMENTLALEKSLGSYFSDTDQRLRVALQHQLNPSDRVFGYGLGSLALNPFQEEHVLSTQITYTAENQTDRLEVGLEVGSSLRGGRSPFTSANRFYLEATHVRPWGPFTARADLQFGLGEDLLFHKQYQLGGRSFEAQWHNDAFRSIDAVFANPLEDVHLTAFGPAGPVAYLRRGDDFVLGGPFGENIVAGRLSLAARPFEEIGIFESFQVEVFSGLGTVWSAGAFLAGFRAENLIADAGLGASYDIGQIRALDRWTRQSDVLSGLKIVARFPLWASDPDLIDSGQDEVAFRWLIGIQL